MFRNRISNKFLFLVLFGTLNMFAQTSGDFTININLSEVALLDIEPQGNNLLSFNFTAPSEAGNSISAPNINSTLWLNYTSAKRNSSPNKRIYAKIDQNIPGVLVKLQASPYSGSGAGTFGTATGKVTLTTNPVVIVNEIGGAFTGSGINNGHRLNISLETSDYSALVKNTNKVITITYTISN